MLKQVPPYLPSQCFEQTFFSPASPHPNITHQFNIYMKSEQVNKYATFTLFLLLCPCFKNVRDDKKVMVM